MCLSSMRARRFQWTKKKRKKQERVRKIRKRAKNEKRMKRICVWLRVYALDANTDAHAHIDAHLSSWTGTVCMQTTNEYTCNCINKQTKPVAPPPFFGLPCHLCRAAIESSPILLRSLRVYSNTQRERAHSCSEAFVCSFFILPFHWTLVLCYQTTCANTFNGSTRSMAFMVLVKQTPYPPHFQCMAKARQLMKLLMFVSFVLIHAWLFSFTIWVHCWLFTQPKIECLLWTWLHIYSKFDQTNKMCKNNENFAGNWIKQQDTFDDQFFIDFIIIPFTTLNWI